MCNSNRTALVLDQNESSRVFFSEALGSFWPGFHVTTATNEREAVEWLSSLSPNLIVLTEPDEWIGATRLIEIINDRLPGNNLKIVVYLNGSSENNGDGEVPIPCHALLDGPLTLDRILSSVRTLF